MFLSRTTYMRVLNGLQPVNCYNYFIYETTIPQLRWTEACELVTNVDRTIIVVKKSKTCYTMCFVSFVPIQKPSATISRCNIIVIILVWPTSWTPALGSLIVCVWVSECVRGHFALLLGAWWTSAGLVIYSGLHQIILHSPSTPSTRGQRDGRDHVEPLPRDGVTSSAKI